MQISLTIQMLLMGLFNSTGLIPLDEIPPGRIIDIGGGGEGVIARAGGARVAAVDKYFSEIQEAREKAMAANWFTADATGLPCASHSFDHATAFFSCMYMSDDVKAKVFRETCRVIKPRGELWVWDTGMSSKGKVFSIRVQVALPGKQAFGTIYGVKAKDQSVEGLVGMLHEAGFRAQVVTRQRRWFLIKAKKAG